MKFTVLWSRSAEAKLADLWLHTSDRDVLSRAAATIDAVLRNDAHLAGESRTRGRRILHEPPLGIIFEVHLADRRVLVVEVWRFAGRKTP